MKFFIDNGGVIYAYESDGSQDELIGDKKALTIEEAEAILNPPPTVDELIEQAEREKQSRIDAANEFMNSKQWPGKAAIGRLKGDELVQYNLWLDYFDALEKVDTLTAPDIEWPTSPT